MATGPVSPTRNLGPVHQTVSAAPAARVASNTSKTLVPHVGLIKERAFVAAAREPTLRIADGTYKGPYLPAPSTTVVHVEPHRGGRLVTTRVIEERTDAYIASTRQTATTENADELRTVG